MGMVLQSGQKVIDSRPLCSVCIANYNGEGYVGKCIESVLNQRDCPGAIEIIVHDDGSTDGSVQLIRSQYSQVRILASDNNVGFCVSNNRMVEASNGQFILLLNNDATLRPDALKTLYDASLRYGEAILGLPQYNMATGELIDIGSLLDPFLNPVPNKRRNRQDVGMIIGACLWLPKDLWQKLGGFPEWFGSLAEDMYLCCLARLWGYPVKALPESGFDHRVGKNLGGGKITAENRLSTTIARRALSERNKTWVMLTCYPFPALLFLFPLHILLLCIEGILLSVIKRDIRLWKDIYWNCLRELAKNRKVILETRSKSFTSLAMPCSFFKPFVWIPYKLLMLIKHGLPGIK